MAHREILELERRIFLEIKKKKGASEATNLNLEFENKYHNTNQQEYFKAISSGLTGLYIYDKKRIIEKIKYFGLEDIIKYR